MAIKEDALVKLTKELSSVLQKPVTRSIKNRIAYIVSHGASYASNGYAVRTQGVAKALNEHGYETLCMVRPGRPWELDKDTTIGAEEIVDGVKYIHSGNNKDFISAKAEAHLKQSAEYFKELFYVYRPEYVIAASDFKIGLPALIAAKQLGIPFFNEVRGFWEMSRIAREPEYERTNSYKRQIERDTFVAHQANAVFTLSETMRTELAKRGVDKQKVHLLPNGVSSLPEPKGVNTALRDSLGIQPGEKVIGFIGSINAYEGLDTLIAACEQFINKGNKIKLLLVGDSQPLSSILGNKDLSNTNGNPPWLIQVGRVSHAKVGDYYSLVDTIVVPRKKLLVSETVPPIKTAEASAYGKRLVLSNVAPLVEYAKGREGVLLFEAENTESLKKALLDIFSQPAPQPHAELFSKHTAALVSILKKVAFKHNAKLSSSNRKSAANLKTQAKMADGRLVDVSTVNHWFYRQGKLTDSWHALQCLQEQGVKLKKSELQLKDFISGLIRLKQGWELPPRQPNPGLMTRRQHILYCLHQSVPHATNGYATRSHGIAVGLQKAGFTVRATTRPGFPWDEAVPELDKGYHEAKVEGVTYSACAGWNLSKTPLDRYLAQAADHYLREAQTSGAEVVVAASNHITALPALMAARRLGLPFVYEVRGLWEITQASTQTEWAGSERYELMRGLEKQAALEADLIITLTKELADELLSWGVPSERIEIVPNAVNAERFQPMARDAAVEKELNLESGVPVIGYAGSAVAYEGLELLMEAMAILKDKGQDFVFVLVGDGKVIDTVKAKARQLGIEGECRFTGRVPFEDVPHYLSCMDILPIPRLSSAVTEMVSALKPLEAMAMGKAMVLSDVSPHITMAGPGGERARLFEKDNAKALSEALLSLIDSPEECNRLGKAARAWIEDERTWNHVTHCYGNALKRVSRYRNAEIAKPLTDAKPLEQLTLGLIADQFTTDTLASAVNVLPLSPDNWREELQSQNIDAMFVESAWKGNDWQWHKKVGYYSEEEFTPLKDLLTHCREQAIPSLFWNKEDPVHFDRFRKAAALCDHVFTTDSRRIIPYLSTPGALSRTASSAPFYASPKIHNLLPSTREWQATAAYGGTYYGKRYPERSEYMDKIMSAAAPLGLTIYDRQHDDSESPYKYPGGLGAYVAGSLSYEEMIQAYKAHPVQINVNSVLDSPTMFSRRVVETAACGSPIISGPALGMNRYLEGAGHVVNNESEAAQALENLLYHPSYRWRTALKGARAVMRAHTTELRLTQMLRTAGMMISAPQPPEFQLVTDELTETEARAVLAQTVRPLRVLASRWESGVQARLKSEGIQCDSLEGQHANANSLWLVADTNTLTNLEPEDFEDLAWPTLYAPQTRIGFNKNPELAEDVWPGVALENHPIEDGLQLMRPKQGQPVSQLLVHVQLQPTLSLRKPPQAHERAPNITPKKTVVIAGHDLKFIKPFYPYFTQAGIRVLLDFWTGHNQHNESASKRLIKQADTVFCEWTLGNAIWYGQHKREGQKLIGRLHLQEIEHALFTKIPFDAFETVMFVGPHILRQGIEKNPVLRKNGIVVYNGVDVDALQSVPRRKTNGKVLGFVGIVPQRKRFDLALDILRELRKEDDGYILRIKGKRPEEYSWMSNRPEEMAWYEAQYRRLEEDPLLKGSVIFDSHGNDMPEWYSGIDFALSTSDFESFHFTIADGAAAGCTPIILPWEGANEIYPKDWVSTTIETAILKIFNGNNDDKNYSLFTKQSFENKIISNKILKII